MTLNVRKTAHYMRLLISVPNPLSNAALWNVRTLPTYVRTWSVNFDFCLESSFKFRTVQRHKTTIFWLYSTNIIRYKENHKFNVPRKRSRASPYLHAVFHANAYLRIMDRDRGRVLERQASWVAVKRYRYDRCMGVVEVTEGQFTAAWREP